jgi:CheY-like chemotaxis protein
MNVLLVDDSSTRTEMLKIWMISFGVTPSNITTVDNTVSARALITRNYYDVLLLDVVLPKRSKEQARWTHGIELLKYVSSSSRVRKPEKIIGITAHSEDIDSFRGKFEEYCLNVIEIKGSAGDWQRKLTMAFTYTLGSKIARAHIQGNLAAITVHGIRTFGQWQERLKRIVHKEASYIDFFSYKYGYFSAIFFAIPYFQQREVSRLKSAISRLSQNQPDKEFIIFAHSFGTFLVAKALNQLCNENAQLRVKALVLSGSVLKSKFDWSFLDKYPGLILVNECGTGDGILCLSEAFIPMTGMAGRTGFYGFNSNNFVNRHHAGGHSLYFDGDEFMKANWLPLFTENPTLALYDERPDLKLQNFVIEQISYYFGRFGFMTILLVLAIYWTVTLI